MSNCLRLHLHKGGQPDKVICGGDDLCAEGLLAEQLANVQVGAVLLQIVVRNDVEVVDILVVAVGGIEHQCGSAVVEDVVGATAV